FAEAAFAYESAAAALRTPEESKQYAMAAWLGAARSLASVGRHLEAALACEHALDAAVAAGQGTDTQAALAMEMYGDFDRRAKETGEAFDRDLKSKAIQRVTALGVGSDLPFFEAKERFDDAAAATPQSPALYDQALADFQKLSPSAPSYERALVYV